jgi:hypothetical protein
MQPGSDGCLFSGCAWRRMAAPPPCFPCKVRYTTSTSIFLPDRSAPPSASLPWQHRKNERKKERKRASTPASTSTPSEDLERQQATPGTLSRYCNPKLSLPSLFNPLGSIRHLRDSRVVAVFLRGFEYPGHLNSPWPIELRCWPDSFEAALKS